jgi:GH24 family phage-related lysozyme (muramidase)
MRFIMRLEGYKLEAYESPKGVWHYGFGHCDKIYNGQLPFKITYRVALKTLKEDVQKFLKGY